MTNRKKIVSTYFLAFALPIALFALAHFALAAAIYSVNNNTTFSYGFASGGTGESFVGESFTLNSTANISGGYVVATSTYGSGTNFYVEIYDSSCNLIASSTSVDGTSVGQKNFTLNSSASLTASTTYWFYVHTYNASPSPNSTQFANGNTVSGGTFSGSVNTGSGAPACGATGSNGGTGAMFTMGLTSPVNSISLNSPTDGSLVYPTSSQITYTTDTGTDLTGGEQYIISTWWWPTNNPNNVEHSSITTASSSLSGITSVLPFANEITGSTGQFNGGTPYTEVATLYWWAGGNSTPILLATSSEITFNTPVGSTGNDAIEITSPTDGATSSPNNFNLRSVRYKTSYSGFNYQIMLSISTSSDMSNAQPDASIYYGGHSDWFYINLTPNVSLVSGTTYYEEASLIYWTEGAGQGAKILVATSSIVSFTPSASVDFTNAFTQQQQYLASSTALSGLAIPYFATSTCASGGGLFSSSTIVQIGCQMTNTAANIGNFFIAGANRVADFAVGIMNATETIFPVNMFVALNDDFASLSATSTDETIALGNGSPSLFNGHEFVILSSSTLQEQTNAGFNAKQFFTYMMYAGTAFFLIVNTAKLVSSFHHQGTPPK